MKRIVILLFEDVDLLDVGGPYEVFLTASRLAQRLGEKQPFDIATVSPDGETVTSYGGMGLVPSGSVADIATADVVVIPGAININAVSARPEVSSAVAALAKRADVVSSVCTGAFLLGDQGLLDGIAWTTHFEDVAELNSRIGSTLGQAYVRWVESGNVITSGGLSNGLAMALHLVERLHSRELAEATATQIEYDWEPTAGIVA